MIYNYKTERLPINFIAFGVMLFAAGIWRMIEMDWKGIIFFVLSVFFLLIRGGVLIDAENKRIKKYIGFLSLRIGDWQDISAMGYLQIRKSRESQNMSVSSITRTETKEIYKLLASMPKRNVEIMSGNKETISRHAQEIASKLETRVVNNFK